MSRAKLERQKIEAEAAITRAKEAEAQLEEAEQAAEKVVQARTRQLETELFQAKQTLRAQFREQDVLKQELLRKEQQLIIRERARGEAG